MHKDLEQPVVLAVDHCFSSFLNLRSEGIVARSQLWFNLAWRRGDEPPGVRIVDRRGDGEYWEFARTASIFVDEFECQWVFF